jgi:lysophospholipase L1-like esterase
MSRRSTMARLATVMGAAGIVLVGLVAIPGVSQAATKSAKKAAPLYYLSLGDSYSVGYQTPSITNGPGYTDKVAKKEHLTLENFGCAGATTTSLLDTIGCNGSQEATYGVAYPTTTQEQAVLNFIDANPGKIGLITVSIGGNDVTACASEASPIPCVATASANVKTNVDQLVSDLNAALTTHGDSAKLVGLTYPDVILGDDVFPAGATNPVLAGQSAYAFDNFINPNLEAAYTSVPYGSFVDVTDASYVKGKINAPLGDDTGSWGLTTGVYTGPTTKLNPFGKTVPESVAEVCSLTNYCTIQGDIHPNPKGYKFITSLILADPGI